MQLVLATHNLHKIREFREMLKALKNIDVLSLHQFPDYTLPEETGNTFLENAVIKAEEAAKTLRQWVLADDSGLVVLALGGRPGVFSKRYSGDEATDTENTAKLLDEMRQLSELDRSAYFECALALASPEGSIMKTVSGTVEGSIAMKEKGRNGFGYDSVFIKNDYDKTFAELDEQTKNKISHRRKAIDKLCPYLESMQNKGVLR